MNLRCCFLLGCVVSLLPGCAFGTRHANLSTVVAHSGASDTKVAKTRRIFVPVPKDARTERDSIGCVRNGFGMRTAEVRPNQDICEWVQSCLVNSLGSEGFTVSSDKGQRPNYNVIIEVEVIRAFVDSHMRYSGEVNLAADIIVDGNRQERQYYIGSASAMNWRGSGAGFADTLEKAMEECMRDAMQKIKASIAGSPNGFAPRNAISCPHCRSPISAGATWCTSCGKRLDDTR
jgi:uncharacterized lipoprotein YajG